MSDENLPQVASQSILSPILDSRLALDVALDVDTDSILEAYGLQFHELESIKQTAAFKQQLEKVQTDLSKAGGAFRLKAQAQAESLLAESYRMALDPDISASVRADLVKQNVRWAGFDAPKQEGNGNDNGFNITINLGGTPDNENQARVINQEGS